jgi:hypothetical protein
MHRNCNVEGFRMESSNFPSVRVDQVLREAAEKILESEESMSGFVEYSIRHQVHY